MKVLKIAAKVVLAAVLLAGCATEGTGPAPMTTVARVDLARYAGTWYEVALIPNRFQSRCVADTRATYAPRDDGRIAVTNRCTGADGTSISVEGDAIVRDTTSNAKLAVSFLPGWLRWTGIGRGNYWVLHLEPDYSVAIVGEPSRRFLWILSRSPELPQQRFDVLLDRVRAAGYDPTLVRRSPQRGTEPSQAGSR
jgi:apolipoprotein D and lipocalin family protein